MLTRYKGQLKLKGWAFAIASRSTMRKTRVALRAASPASCTRCCGTKPSSHRLRLSNPSRQETASSSRKERSRRRRGCSTRPTTGRLRFQPSPPRTQLTPSSANRARREGRHPKASKAEKSSPLSVAERTAIVSEGRIPDLAWRPCGPRVRDKVGVRVRDVSNQWRLWRRSAFIVPAAPPCGGHRRCATSPWGLRLLVLLSFWEPHPSHRCLAESLRASLMSGSVQARSLSLCRRWL